MKSKMHSGTLIFTRVFSEGLLLVGAQAVLNKLHGTPSWKINLSVDGKGRVPGPIKFYI